MKYNNKKDQFALWVFTLLTVSCAFGQGQPDERKIELTELAKKGAFRLENRTVQTLTDGNRHGVRLDEKPGANEGVAWLPKTTFTQGTIEVDMRGKDVLQRSFVGIAFHGSSERNYDAIYFRPFNFRSTDPVRRIHAVQYISLPNYDWPTLRKDFPDQYEKSIDPAPDPNEWFHVRIVVDNETIQVFVNDIATPSLTVKKLGERREGLIGLWVGASSGGDFANLKITPNP
ncbi:hypothetical protein GCM10027347_21340 [Larkinella harenae]